MKPSRTEDPLPGSDSWRLVVLLLVGASALFITSTYFMMY